MAKSLALALGWFPRDSMSSGLLRMIGFRPASYIQEPGILSKIRC